MLHALRQAKYNSPATGIVTGVAVAKSRWAAAAILFLVLLLNGTHDHVVGFEDRSVRVDRS
jgi:hypothetical protein